MTNKLGEKISWGTLGKGFFTLEKDNPEDMIFLWMCLCLCRMYKEAAVMFNHGKASLRMRIIQPGWKNSLDS